MTMPYDDASTDVKPFRRLEVFGGDGRRRRWSDADKAAIIAESYSGAGTVCVVAWRHGLASGQLFSWRRQLRQPIEDAAIPATTMLLVPALVEALSAPVTVAVPSPRSAVKKARKSRMTPLRDHLLDQLKRSTKLFADETTAPVLDPGRGRTKTGSSRPMPATRRHHPGVLPGACLQWVLRARQGRSVTGGVRAAHAHRQPHRDLRAQRCRPPGLARGYSLQTRR